MSVDPLLMLLQKNARRSTQDLAQELGISESEVEQKISRWEEQGVVLGFRAVTDPHKTGEKSVMATIEVRLSPEQKEGYDRIAERIARFSQVRACYLMSGGYDLSIRIVGQEKEIAQFVSEKLAPLKGVRSIATHFQLKVYKEGGFLLNDSEDDSRLPVSP